MNELEHPQANFKPGAINLLHEYSQYLLFGNANGIALLFAEDGEFNDYAPTKMAMKPINIKGRENILRFFSGVFKQGGLKVSNIAVNENAMRYDLAMGSNILLCLGVAKVENNLIKEYKVVAA